MNLDPGPWTLDHGQADASTSTKAEAPCPHCPSDLDHKIASLAHGASENRRGVRRWATFSFCAGADRVINYGAARTSEWAFRPESLRPGVSAEPLGEGPHFGDPSETLPVATLFKASSAC